MNNMKLFAASVIALLLLCIANCFAQSSQGWRLEKMPPDLERDYALSALPPHLRDGATVYLLDPEKGYYIGRQGTNGWSTFVNRTEFEFVEFAPDVYEPISYSAEGSKAYLPSFFDVAKMRASGNYSPTQIKDSIVKRVKDGKYKPAPGPGLSYMLSPLIRVHREGGIANMTMPHFMFYAPYMDDADIGGGWRDGGHQPFVVSSRDALDKSHAIFNYIIMPAGETEKAKIIEENKGLLKRLAAYHPFLTVETGPGEREHHH
jgi:hypothetical protein